MDFFRTLSYLLQLDTMFQNQSKIASEASYTINNVNPILFGQTPVLLKIVFNTPWYWVENAS